MTPINCKTCGTPPQTTWMMQTTFGASAQPGDGFLGIEIRCGRCKVSVTSDAKLAGLPNDELERLTVARWDSLMLCAGELT